MFYGPGDLRFEQLPIPEPGPGEIVLKIGAALTCGTDVKTLRRGHPVMIPRVPTVFGHEFAGTVTAVGAGVRTVHEGDRVVAANSAPCGECRLRWLTSWRTTPAGRDVRATSCRRASRCRRPGRGR